MRLKKGGQCLHTLLVKYVSQDPNDFVGLLMSKVVCLCVITIVLVHNSNFRITQTSATQTLVSRTLKYIDQPDQKQMLTIDTNGMYSNVSFVLVMSAIREVHKC